eukprot:SAG31_NODE_12094_length_969_cov_1.111494_2_plen_127_part_00
MSDHEAFFAHFQLTRAPLIARNLHFGTSDGTERSLQVLSRGERIAAEAELCDDVLTKLRAGREEARSRSRNHLRWSLAGAFLCAIGAGSSRAMFGTYVAPAPRRRNLQFWAENILPFHVRHALSIW